MTGSLWLYSKDETTNFNNSIENAELLKAKLLRSTVAQPAPNQPNGLLKNAAIVVPLKYLNNFWRSVEISLIKYKTELKLRSMKHFEA